MSEPILYLCKNPACPLGSPFQHGRFTGGITAEQKHLLTGAPLEALVDGTDFGEGICTNCGQPGERWDPVKAEKGALAEAKRLYEAHVAQIKEGVN